MCSVNPSSAHPFADFPCCEHSYRYDQSDNAYIQSVRDLVHSCFLPSAAMLNGADFGRRDRDF
jgi:hypothetical protein